MRQTVEVTSAPAAEPVVLADAKTFMRVDGTADDSLITSQIAAARQLVEEYLRRSLITQTRKLTLDWFPMAGNRDWWDGIRDGHIGEVDGTSHYISLPWGKVQSITSITTYDDGNNSAVFSASNYYLDAGDRAVLNDDETWPTDLRERAAVEVVYVAGYGDAASDVPYPIREAIKHIVNAMYQASACDDGCLITEAAERLLQPYRILHEHNYG